MLETIHFFERSFIYCRSRHTLHRGVIFWYYRSRQYSAWRFILVLLSIETTWLCRRHPKDNYVARLKHYLHLAPRITSRFNIHYAEDRLSWVNIHASPVNIHASWNTMHQESIFLHSGRSCLASQYHASWKIMHRESIFMHRGRSCIASSCIERRYSCMVKRYASQKNIHA